MRKFLLMLAIALPVATMAQTEPPVIHEFYKKAKDLVTTFKLDDDISIMQVNTDNDNFDVLAINDQMKVVWKTTLPGHAMNAGKFKGKVVAIATTDFSGLKQTTNNDYKGYVLDPATGKTIIEKSLFTGSATNVERPSFYFNDAGDYFKMAVTVTAFANRVHVGMPGPLALLSLNRAEKQIHTITGFDFIDFDINLEKRFAWQPSVPEGYIVSYTCNDKGYFLVACDKDPGTVEVLEYETGKSQPIGHASASFPVRKNVKVDAFNQSLLLTGSKASSDIAYIGVVYENEEKDVQLSLARLDVISHTSQVVNEAFTKDRIKALEKSFEPINKKIKSPDLGNPKYLDIRDLVEVNDKVVARISGRYIISGQYVGYYVENSSIVNVYDFNLKPQFQQVIPTARKSLSNLPFGLHKEGDKLYFTNTDIEGPKSTNALFCLLNLNTGKWERMEWVVNKDVDHYDIVDGPNIMWFKNYCIIPYLSSKGLMRNNYEITILQNAL